MSPTRWSLIAATLVVSLSFGCTRVVVNKDPGHEDIGIRYWRPKPYLFIGPAPLPEAKKDDSADKEKKPGLFALLDGGSTKAADPEPQFIKAAMQLKYLPDYNEEYSILLKPGLGVGNLALKLEDGWNLTSVNMQTDQKVPEIISSVSSLIGAVGGVAKPATPKERTTDADGQPVVLVDTRPDVPLGFYEAVIATDPSGRKHLFGWRYVGFMPFTGCPVEPCVTTTPVTCDPSELWGIVPGLNTLKFQRLSEIQQGTANPYRYEKVLKVR